MTDRLSTRERQMAELVAQGKTNIQIAATLHLSHGTVKEYLNRTYHKLHLRNRTDLAIWWMGHREA